MKQNFLLENKCNVTGLGKCQKSCYLLNISVDERNHYSDMGPPKVSNKYQKMLKLNDAFF